MASNPFEAANAALFACAMAETIQHRRGDVIRPLRAIVGRSDRDLGYGSAVVITGPKVQVQRIDMPSITREDRFLIDGIWHELSGEAELDVEGVTWGFETSHEAG